MALLNIGGVDLPAPDNYKVSQSDLDSANTGRSENGVMFRERVRDGVYKIEASWTNLTQAEMQTVLNAVSGASFTVVFFFGSQKTATMYAGDKSVDLVCVINGESRWNVAYNLIEY